MRKSKFTETQIIAILKEADAGRKVQDVCRKHGISPATYYQWKSKFGGMEASDIKRAQRCCRSGAQRLWGELLGYREHG